MTNTPSSPIILRFAPSNPSVAYLCADDGPAASPLTATSWLYKSTDGGQTWQRVSGAPTLHPVPAAVSGPAPLAGCRVFVDASDANDVFLQQTEIEPVGGSFAIARALWRSRDGGQIWQQLTAVDRTDGFDALTVLGPHLIARPHPSFYGGAAGCDPSVTPKAYSDLLGSDDGGMTWHDIGQGIESQGYSPHDFAAAGSALIAAADKVPATACSNALPVSALWRSNDSGMTWTKVTTPGASSGASISALSFTPKVAGSGFNFMVTFLGVAWAPPESPSSGVTPLYSSDSGATWTALPTASVSFPTSSSNFVVAPSGAVLLGGRDTDPVFVLYPGNGTPAWTLYAPGLVTSANLYMDWQVVPGSGGATLWSVGFNYGGPSVVEHLPLP